MKLLRRFGVLSLLFAIVMEIGPYVWRAQLGHELLKMWILSSKNDLHIDDDHVDLFIPSGSNAKDVFRLLENSGFTTSSKDLAPLADLMNYKGGNVVPGRYRLTRDMSNRKLIGHLRAGVGRIDAEVVFNNARTLEDITAQLSSQLEVKEGRLKVLLQDKSIYGRYGFTSKTFLTLFIPNTYKMNWTISGEQILARMAQEYKKFWNSERRRKARDLGLTQSEVSILASIVEEEQKIHFKEHKTIAGLYWNRLQRGMKLQADPTVKYAVGDFSINRVLTKHLQIDSPYNTYQVNGLPPGPICVPDARVIDAVLNLEKHNYLYMCAKPGSEALHNFSINYSQHLRYARQYQSWLNNR